MRNSKELKQYIKESAQQPTSRQSQQFTQLVHDTIRTRETLKTMLKKLAQLSAAQPPRKEEPK